MSRPTKAPSGATVGRDNFKKKMKRPSVDNTKNRPFDYKEYVRMEYWSKAQARKIRQRNPVYNKSIGGRRKAITAYLDTKVNKLKTLALLRRIRQVKKSQKEYEKRGVRVPGKVAWSVWGSRTSVERKNDHQVIRRVTRWANNELARMKEASKHGWTEVKNGKGRGKLKVKPERSHVQCSNVYDELATMPPHEEEPTTKPTRTLHQSTQQ